MFKVQKRMCETCIYRPDSTLDLARLEAACADPRMPGHFSKFRECHHAKPRSGVCCRGFWEAHKDHFDAGQLAQRLNLVEFVDVDYLAEQGTKARRRWKSQSVNQTAKR
jgi:hypothetical protein